MKIIVRSRSASQFQKFLRRNAALVSSLGHQCLERTHASLSSIVASASANADLSHLVIIEADLLLGPDFVERVSKVVSQLDSRNPDWALVSSIGYSPACIGPNHSKRLDYSFWSEAPKGYSDKVIPVSSFESGVLIFNMRAISKIDLADSQFSPRASLLKLAFEFAMAGLPMFATGVFAAKPTRQKPRLAAPAKSLPKLDNEWFANRTRATKLEMAFGSVIVRPVPNVDSLKNGFDLEFEAIRNARDKATSPNLLIVTDATEADPADLRRLQLSIAALAARCEQLEIEHTVLGEDSHLEIGAKLVNTSFISPQTMTFDEVIDLCSRTNEGNSAYWIEVSADQWVFPQAAANLENLLTSYGVPARLTLGALSGEQQRGRFSVTLMEDEKRSSTLGEVNLECHSDALLVGGKFLKGLLDNTNEPNHQGINRGLRLSISTFDGFRSGRNVARQFRRLFSLTELVYLLKQFFG